MAMGIRLGISVIFSSTDTTDATREITRHQTDFCFCAVIPVNLPFSWTDQWPLEHETTRRSGYRQRRSGGRRSGRLNGIKIYWSYPHKAIGGRFALKDNGKVSFNWPPRQYGLWTKGTGWEEGQKTPREEQKRNEFGALIKRPFWGEMEPLPVLCISPGTLPVPFF